MDVSNTEVVYQIHDWENRYEISASKKGTHRWVAEPNGAMLDKLGLSIKKLLRHENGLAAYGVYELLVKQASRCKPEDRGQLPSIDDLDLLIDPSIDEIRSALEILTSDRVGLIDEVDQANQCQADPDAAAANQGGGAANQGDHPPSIGAVEVGKSIPAGRQSDPSVLPGANQSDPTMLPAANQSDPTMLPAANQSDPSTLPAANQSDPSVLPAKQRTKPKTKGKKKREKKTKAKSKNVLDSVSCSDSPRQGKPPNQTDDIKRKISFQRWQVETEIIWGTFRNGRDLGKHPKQSAQYKADETSSENLFNDLIWPENLSDANRGKTRVGIALELIPTARRNGEIPMRWLTDRVRKELKNGLAK